MIIWRVERLKDNVGPYMGHMLSQKAIKMLKPMYDRHNRSIGKRPNPFYDHILNEKLKGQRNKILNNNCMKFGFISKTSLMSWFEPKDRYLLDQASSKKNKFVIK
jgi:hypothetical protein